MLPLQITSRGDLPNGDGCGRVFQLFHLSRQVDETTGVTFNHRRKYPLRELPGIDQEVVSVILLNESAGHRLAVEQQTADDIDVLIEVDVHVRCVPSASFDRIGQLNLPNLWPRRLLTSHTASANLLPVRAADCHVAVARVPTRRIARQVWFPPSSEANY